MESLDPTQLILLALAALLLAAIAALAAWLPQQRRNQALREENIRLQLYVFV